MPPPKVHADLAVTEWGLTRIAWTGPSEAAILPRISMHSDIWKSKLCQKMIERMLSNRVSMLGTS